ncbi:phage/plasmid primase, P4 family [Paucibacter sp. B2R-40]|uniref:DNA primase family protein n=1 Tax=Paucibacter sp. B2R-40 TaxID=2893554 RepID=UPI0021E3D622|nr:phage/plasmid primase, P4 family [Paucibacter sp. B2R-40]MCV2356621.1 phage/plasmid primase, P4 family [Paucibacter sp. B2R-40]
MSAKEQVWAHHQVTDIASAVKKAMSLCDAGHEVYFACAEYLTPKSRKAENVLQSWTFHFDIDVGEEKAEKDAGYRTVAEAEAALAHFCTVAGLPMPTHRVYSGGGLHVYFALDKPVDKVTWQDIAQKLKDSAKSLGFLADPSRTADIASILRVPGTVNHKYSPARQVTLEHASAPIDSAGLLQAINETHDKLCAKPEIQLGLSQPIGEPADKRDPGSAKSYGPPDLTKLTSALKVLDPDCDDGTWKLHRLAPMAAAARAYPELADELKALARSWSSGELCGKSSTAWTTPGSSNGVTGQAAFNATWDRFFTGPCNGRPITVGTIYLDAKNAGWRFGGKTFEPLETETVIPVDMAAKVKPVAEALQAQPVIDDLVAKVKDGDCGAPLEPEYLAALAMLSARDPAEYQRVRRQLKQINKHISLASIDNAVKGKRRTGGSAAATHHGYATSTVDRLTFENWAPVGHEGRLFVVDPRSKLWVAKESVALEREVAETHDDHENCTRRADYSAIAQHACSLVSNGDFFADAPHGLACPDGFYRIEDGTTKVEPLTPAHRQRIGLDITPSSQPTPLFNQFLQQTFKANDETEMQQQIALVQEIAGAVMLGLMPLHQKAILFYDPYGRAGKGTLESILRNLVPEVFVTAISPFSWNEPYFLVSLAGARLNVVGELPENESIPAAIFKSVLGGDLLTGRNPAHRPTSFKNEAAHLFMSNHMISTKDQSEAFFARWLIVEFPNSLLRSGLRLDPHIAGRIIEKEMPGIAGWALEGAARLLRNGKFSPSKANDRLMQKWRRSSNSLDECIFEDFDLAPDLSIRRSGLYEHYKNWCSENGRKPFAKARVKELLEFNVGHGIKLAKLDGYEIFRGLAVKPDREITLGPIG